MNGLELKAARLIFGLSQAEAAEQIGTVSQRSWAYWEKGERTVPKDVIKSIKELLFRRRQTIKMAEDLIKKQHYAKIAVVFYDNPQDSGMSLLEVRYNNALAVQLHFDYGAELVRFDPQSYVDWLVDNDLVDQPQKRSEWAVYQSSSKK